MRTLLLATSITLLASACNDEIAPLPEPPVLKVTSPQRSLIRDHAGPIVVTGTVAPNSEGVPVKKVMVNNVAATVNADGTFNATLDLKAGATLIHTEAVDDRGTKADDTRSVEAGELRMPGANVENAITTAVSKQAFARIADAAGTMIEGVDMKAMLAPMNPVVHSGDEDGEDCLFGRLYIDDFKMSNATITLVPVNGGLSFSAKLDGVDIPGRARYAVACANGSSNVRVTASSVVVKATLLVSPDGMNGFKTDFTGTNVTITGLNVSASGIPGTILDMIPVESLIEKGAPLAARLFMGPMLNKALGGLGGPKEIEVLGKTLRVEVRPTEVLFDSLGGMITLDTKMLIVGTEGSQGFIFTDNGYPSMDPGDGLQIGLADDLANSMLSQVVATGLLNIHMEKHGGTFDSTALSPTSPPMISADPSTGMMRLVIPDMMSTFLQAGTPVGKAAINAEVELKITPANNGYGIAIELGTPKIYADVMDDIPNDTMLSDADLAKAVELGLQSQISSISALLGGIPLPAMPAGLVMRDMSVGSDDGYVMVKGTLE